MRIRPNPAHPAPHIKVGVDSEIAEVVKADEAENKFVAERDNFASFVKETKERNERRRT